MASIFGVTKHKMEEPPIASGSMNSYKDNSSISVLDIYQGGALFVQDYIYKHIRSCKLVDLLDIYKYISYEDMASLLLLNRTYGYNTNNRLTNIYSKFPTNYRNNVETIYSTLSNTNKDRSLSIILNIEPSGTEDSNHSGDWWNVEVIGTDIIVVVKAGFEKLLYDRKKKLGLLKELCERSFSVLGESNTYQQPYFRDLIVSI